MSILCIVPARKGSERLPGKNRMEIGGVELWLRAARIGSDTPAIDEVIVSTDYDDLVAPECHGCAPITIAERPAHLCTATAPIEQVIAYHMRDEHDLIVLLNPTSPLRTVETVASGIEAAQRCKGTAVSLVECRDPHLRVNVGPSVLPSTIPGPGWLRGQDVPAEYRMHGAVFVTRPEVIREGRLLKAPCGYVLTPWLESVDIDTAEDMEMARRLSGEGD